MAAVAIGLACTATAGCSSAAPVARSTTTTATATATALRTVEVTESATPPTVTSTPPATTVTETETSTATVTVGDFNDISLKDPMTISIACSTTGGDYTIFTDVNYSSAWNGSWQSCDSGLTGIIGLNPFTSLQKKAVEIAYGGGDDMLPSVATLYSICTNPAVPTTASPPSDSQAAELAGALVICPKHPKALQIQGLIAADAQASAKAKAAAAEQARIDGLVAKKQFALDGSHLVGKDLEPGTYQSYGESVQNCYWELSDATGNIIKNNFISIAPQFQIVIPPSASGFTNRGCWFERTGG